MPEPRDAWDDLPPHIQADFGIQVYRDLSRETDRPRLLVLITHGYLELLINKIMEAKGKKPKKTHGDNLKALQALKVLSEEQFGVYEWFRGLRNRAAHEPLFRLSADDLTRIRESEFRDPSNFHRLCLQLISNLWNEHTDVLAPIFTPGMLRGLNAPA